MAEETTNPRLEALVASLRDSQDKTTSAVSSSNATIQSVNSQIESIGKSIVSEIGTSVSALQSTIKDIKIPEFDTSSIIQAIGNVNIPTPPAQVAPEVNVNVPEQVTSPPEINVNVPEQVIPTPEVNVDVPEQVIPPPEVDINVPEQVTSPEINVNVPEQVIPTPEVDINVPEQVIPTPEVNVNVPDDGLTLLRAEAKPRWTQQLNILGEIKSHLFGIEAWAEHTVTGIKEIRDAVRMPVIAPSTPAPTLAADDTSPDIVIPSSPDDSVDPLIKVSENTSETVKLVKQLINVTKAEGKAGKKRNILFRAIGGTLKKSFSLGMKAFRFTKESARERLRAMMGAEPGGEGDDEEPKAKKTGFFSKIAGAMMSPFKGLAKVGKGVEGFMKGLARGLMAFANPLVLVGVTFLSLSLPILAAGLAAAFKVFDLIAGEGKAMEVITGIIKALGEAVGIALGHILEGVGRMISAAGPGIKLFFESLAVVIEALQPIIKDVLDTVKAIITDPAFNKTIQKVLETIQVAINAVRDVLMEFMPEIKEIMASIKEVILGVIGAINTIVETVGSVIERILASFDNVVNQIGPIIEQIGVTIETIINAIGDNVAKIGKSIEGVFNAIGANVTLVIGAIEKLIVNIIDSVVGGIERIAGVDPGNMLQTAAGMTAIGLALVPFAIGGAIAGLVAGTGAFDSIADGLQKFAAINPANLPGVGTGMTAVGKGLAAFGVGGAIASVASLFTGGGMFDTIATTLTKFSAIPSANLATIGVGMGKIGDGMAAFGKGGAIASGADFFTGEGTFANIAKQLTMFGKIEGGNLVTVGTGMKSVGDGLGAFGKGSSIAAAANLFTGDGSMFGSIATNVKRFGDLDGTNLVTVGTGISALGKGLQDWGGGQAIGAIGGAIAGLFKDDPTEDFKKFADIGDPLKAAADGITGLAAAFSLFSDADPAQAAAALNTFGKNVNVATLNKIRGAMASGAEGMLVPAGAVTPAILHGGAGGEVVAPLPDLSKMVVQAGATGAALVAGKVEGDELRAQQAKSTAIDASTQTQIVNNNQPMTMVALPAEPKNTEVLPVG